MKQKTAMAFYIVLAVLMLTDFYLIFNVGNPDSLLRSILPSTEYDVVVTLGVSALIAFLSFFVFRGKGDDTVEKMLRENSAYIRQLRSDGQSDEDITGSFLAELAKAGRVGRGTRRKVLTFLKEME